MSQGTLTGTGTLLRLILRRDRVLMPIWVVGLAIPTILQALGTRELFPTPEQQMVYAETLRTPALVALYGPLFGTSIGALAATRAGFAPVLVALVSLMVVIRHTRVDEEAGRRELLGSTAVGRHAPLAAAILTTVGANVALGTVLALGMISQNLPVEGSAALGLSYAAVGAVFAAVGGLAAQVAEAPGRARGLGLIALATAFVLRLAGDVSAQAGGGLGWMSWLSPIGWGQQVRPYADERWWVLLLPVALTAVVATVAVVVSARRDVGGGVIAPRPGPATADRSLGSALGLAWRLHRGSLAGWAVGFALLGLIFGAVADEIGRLVAVTPEFAEAIARIGGQEALTDAYLAASMGVMGLIASGYAIQAALRLRAEESSLRAEPILATGVSRLRWAGSHVAFTLLGPAVAMVAGGLLAGLSHGVASGDVAGEVPRLLGGALVQLPAVWVLAGIAVALFGLLPRLAAASWGALALFVFLGQLGQILQLDQWVLNLSPFTHVPNLPGGELAAPPIAWLAAVAGGLTALGLAAWRRRDLASTA
jgi:ABC-2 type transport system permease protein